MDHLLVKLDGLAVGDLRRRSGDSWDFRFRSDYIERHPRPVLGQCFEDDLRRVHRATNRLPPFFSNLLPEGALRDLLARRAHVNEQREALLLEALGKDLPGAIVVEEGGEATTAEVDDELPPPLAVEGFEAPLKFSLAGVQLKFSVLRSGGRLTVPISGMGGNWIAKLPDAQHPRVPANEFSMLRWARHSGIEVPDHELIQARSIEGLPREGVFTEQEALLIRRFDRLRARRIHQEDFAQVLALYPWQKYKKYNYETIGRIVHAIAGPDAFAEYARRLAFVVLSGNGDAHHKNWSLLYLDGRTASLAPAYDLVFTRAYYEDDPLALNFNGSKKFDEVGLGSFRRLARKCEYDETSLATEVAKVVERIRAGWVELESDLPISSEVKARLRRHLDAIHL
jgi:serine/threonine-protein kinase HipA